jgi:ABC-2 type transport system ATP-binding protein
MYLLLRNLKFHYHGNRVLDDVSIDIKEGEVFGLIGENGSGKTTILKILCGLLKPNKGKIFLNGSEVHPYRKELAQIVGYCPQENTFFEKLTVKENILYFANIYNIEKQTKPRVREFASYVGLESKIDSISDNLSGGMKRRLNLLCGILHKPPILVLDEPSTQLDPISRNHLWKLIEKINKSGATVILATNVMEEAYYLCDRIAFLENGKKKKEGKTREVIDSVY